MRQKKKEAVFRAQHIITAKRNGEKTMMKLDVCLKDRWNGRCFGKPGSDSTNPATKVSCKSKHKVRRRLFFRGESERTTTHLERCARKKEVTLLFEKSIDLLYP